MRKLLILGAGQYGKVAYEIAEAMGQFEEISFLDDSNPVAVGKLDEYAAFRKDYDYAVVALGDAVLRLKLLDELEECGYQIPTLIHPAAYVSPSAQIGKGSFVEPMTTVHTDAAIGAGCIISAGTIVNHNSIIGDGSHLNCGTIVASNAVVEPRTKTEYGTRII